MILLGADRVHVKFDAPQIQRLAVQAHLAWLDQVVFQIGVAQIPAMRGAGHPGAVAVPVQQVEGRRRLPEQVVVHHVGPYRQQRAADAGAHDVDRRLPRDLADRVAGFERPEPHVVFDGDVVHRGVGILSGRHEDRKTLLDEMLYHAVFGCMSRM